MNMIEKVARAIHASLGYEANWPTPECTQCMDATRAAIEAMREPSEKMQHAGLVALDESGECDCSQHDVWEAMINAALAET